MKFLLFFLTLFCSLDAYELSICAVFQNEAPFLREWILYHQLVGVEHFWLYNNNSTDNFREVLQPFIEKGEVELIEWPSVKQFHDWNNYTAVVQPAAYNDAIMRASHLSKWLALIDLDEFIIPVKEETITECLDRHFKHCSGVAINWQYYGTSFIAKTDPCYPMISQLLYKMETHHKANLFYKSIVRPERVSKCTNPHMCLYKPGFFHVDTMGRNFVIELSEVNVDLLRINHYWTRDEDWFENVKIPRYIQWCGEDKVDKFREFASEMNAVFDPCIIERFPILTSEEFLKDPHL